MQRNYESKFTLERLLGFYKTFRMCFSWFQKKAYGKVFEKSWRKS
jgi:hypothetical protein